MKVDYILYDWEGLLKWLQRNDGVFLVDPEYEKEFTLFFAAI